MTLGHFPNLSETVFRGALFVKIRIVPASFPPLILLPLFPLPPLKAESPPHLSLYQLSVWQSEHWGLFHRMSQSSSCWGSGRTWFPLYSHHWFWINKDLVAAERSGFLLLLCLVRKALTSLMHVSVLDGGSELPASFPPSLEPSLVQQRFLDFLGFQQPECSKLFHQKKTLNLLFIRYLGANLMSMYVLTT